MLLYDPSHCGLTRSCTGVQVWVWLRGTGESLLCVGDGSGGRVGLLHTYEGMDS